MTESPQLTLRLPGGRTLPLVRTIAWAGLLAGLVGLWVGIPHASTPGADETLHSFAGLRMAEALRAFDLPRFWHEFVKPDFYTPVGRLGMAIGSLFSREFGAPRAATSLAWILSIALAAPLTRRLVRPDQGDAAVFWTFLFALTSWLGVSYARGSYLEAWSALATVTCVHLYLRARERGTAASALACGAALGVALLVKYTYGLFIVGAVGLSGLIDLARREPRAGANALWCALGMMLVLGWWFVLPLPSGLGMGAAHRERFVTYLAKAASLSSHGPEFLGVVWILQSGLSIPVFLVQIAGIAWGVLRWRNPTARICAILAIVAPLGFAAYPFRIDRFLLPTMFAQWALAGALLASIVGRMQPQRKAFASIALLLILVATRGVGGTWVLRTVFPESPIEAARAAVRTWTRPYAFRLAPASGPEGTRDVLDAAAHLLEPTENFLWIGGTGTELPPILLDWRMFLESGDRAVVFRDRPEIEWLWEEPPAGKETKWDEEIFRAWALLYPQIGVIDPADAKDRPREFETRYVAWLARHPGFEESGRETVHLQGGRPHKVIAYKRRE